MVAIINPVYPIVFLSYAEYTVAYQVKTQLFEILQYYAATVYIIYFILLLLPKADFARLLLDFGLVALQLAILISSSITPFASALPTVISYSIIVAFLSLIVAFYQIANYFISKGTVKECREKSTQELH